MCIDSRTHFSFTITCPQCAGTRFAHVNGCEHNGTESVAVCRCLGCGCEWSVVVLLRPLRDVDAAMRKRAQRQRERANA